MCPSYEDYPRPSADKTVKTNPSPPSGTGGSPKSTEGAMGNVKTTNGEGSGSKQ
jgi:hypothetical protein